MIKESKQVNHYEVLDVSMSAKPEMIRTAYIRAKNTYARDSLAAYTLFDQEDSRRILEQIEEAYNVLSDPERRQKYDESHGFMSYSAPDPFAEKAADAIPATAASTVVTTASEPFVKSSGASERPVTSSPIERLQSQNNTMSPSSFSALRSYRVQRSYTSTPEMEEKLRLAENVTGSFLKSAREYKQASFEEIMDLTKMSKTYLQSLEADELGKLPAAVYVRGFVAQYAKALGLDTERVTNSYMSYFKSKRA